MGSFDFVTLFFLVAAVIIFIQLRSVLGRRTGSERPPFDPYSKRETAEAPDAGGKVDTFDLPAMGIKGNSHMLMMDRNSDDIAKLINDWIAKQGLVN